MNDQELRQLRVWAVETALGKASIPTTIYEGGQAVQAVQQPSVEQVLGDAKKLFAYIVSSH